MLFVSSRLDYCISLYPCLSQKQPSWLQLVQNSAAKLLMGIKKVEHHNCASTGFFYILECILKLYYSLLKQNVDWLQRI